MVLDEYISCMRPEIERQLKAVIDKNVSDQYPVLRSMLSYHMGWEGEGAGPEAQGKRIRPLLLLLSTSAAGAEWQVALPAAAAVEFVHNFSLIHDDIEDQSPLRRGRATVWKKWGLAQAINTGDLMFSLAHISIQGLHQTASSLVTLAAIEKLHKACVDLTHGQFLDLYNETESVLQIDAYWPMVAGKTAALLATCTELGAIIAGLDEARQENFRQFGYNLGLAFQVLDDWLGIWGDSTKIGKSTDSDLVSGKKTLPVLYALEQEKDFARRWKTGPIKPEEVPELANLLDKEGAQQYTLDIADRLTAQSLEALLKGANSNDAKGALEELANILLRRKS